MSSEDARRKHSKSYACEKKIIGVDVAFTNKKLFSGCLLSKTVKCLCIMLYCKAFSFIVHSEITVVDKILDTHQVYEQSSMVLL